MFNLYRKNVDSTAILLKLDVDEDEDEHNADNVPRKYFVHDLLYSRITFLIHLVTLQLFNYFLCDYNSAKPT